MLDCPYHVVGQFVNYLSGRSQCIPAEGFTSSYLSVTNDVPLITTFVHFILEKPWLTSISCWFKFLCWWQCDVLFHLRRRYISYNKYLTMFNRPYVRWNWSEIPGKINVRESSTCHYFTDWHCLRFPAQILGWFDWWCSLLCTNCSTTDQQTWTLEDWIFFLRIKCYLSFEAKRRLVLCFYRHASLRCLYTLYTVNHGAKLGVFIHRCTRVLLSSRRLRQTFTKLFQVFSHPVNILTFFKNPLEASVFAAKTSFFRLYLKSELRWRKLHLNVQHLHLESAPKPPESQGSGFNDDYDVWSFLVSGFPV